MSSVSLSPLLGVADAGTVDRSLRTQPGQSGAQAAAAQFEAILVRQLLGEAFKPLLGSSGGEKAPGSDVYQYLVTDVVSQSVAQGGGLGIAKMLMPQLTQKGEATDNKEVSS
jgi:Rod binding domain-containing protein